MPEARPPTAPATATTPWTWARVARGVLLGTLTVAGREGGGHSCGEQRAGSRHAHRSGTESVDEAAGQR